MQLKALKSYAFARLLTLAIGLNLHAKRRYLKIQHARY